MARFRATTINPKSFHPSQLKFILPLLLLSVFMALPLIYIFNHAFKPIGELFAYPPRFFVIRPTWKNFQDLFAQTSTSGIPISRYLFNSIVITLVVVLLSIIFSTMAGYALSKLRFRLKGALFELNTIALMFVGTAVSIPRYLIIENFRLIDTFWSHIFPLIAIPVGLFLIKQFIDQIPNSLMEAAKIDGASDWTIYFKIILPLVRPAIATVAILSFQAVWNNVETSTMYVDRENLKTFAFYMSTLTSATGNTVAGQGMSAAASLIMFIPNLVIFIFMQNKVMNTMAHSGIK